MRLSISSLTALFLSALILFTGCLGIQPSYAESEPQLNFKIYNPDDSILGPIEDSESKSEETQDSAGLELKAE